MTRTLGVLIALSLVPTLAPAQTQWAEKMFTKGRTHDFGTVPRGAQLTHSFEITNPYAVEMHITEVKSGCGCVTARATKTVLQPRETGAIEVRMDGTRYVGPKTVGIRVTVGPRYISSAELRVTANGRTDVVFNPGQVSFGTVTAGETPTKSVMMEYAGTLDWKVNEIITKDMPYEVVVKEAYRRPGQVGYQVSVTLKKDAPVGLLRHELLVKTNDPASPTVPLLVEGQVMSSLSVQPSSLSLGVMKVGDPLIRRVLVRGASAFKITEVKADGVEVEGGLPDKEASTHFVTLKLKASTAGAFRRQIQIKTTAQEAPLLLEVDGFGVN
ncbi:MAG: DUF1573 domain-containing protein [Gemmataceae bacterium]